MKRIFILALASCLVLFCLVGCKEKPPSHFRNVILISIDTLRADHLSSYGYPQPTSPQIDAFAKQSVLFKNAFATSSWTLPSHVSMLTGLYADAHGVDRSSAALNEKGTTLAKSLHEHGYKTGAIVCAPLLRKRYGLYQGFDYYDESLIEKSYKKVRTVKVAKKVTQKALKYVEDHSTDRFFLFLHYWDVHYDYNPPQEYIDLFDPGYEGTMTGTGIHDRTDIVPGMDERDLKHLIATYDGEIRFTDDAIGDLLRGLERLGADKTTMIWLTADHGEEFLEHGSLAHSQSCYQELIHVPMIAHVPWLPPGQAVVETPVSLVDLFPSIMDLLDFQAPTKRIQGVSLKPLLSGGTITPRSIYASTLLGQFQRTRKDYFHWYSMITANLKKVHRLEVKHDNIIGHLFDLPTDPLERKDLWEDELDFAKQLDEKLVDQHNIHQKLRRANKIDKEKKLDQEMTDTLKGLGYI